MNLLNINPSKSKNGFEIFPIYFHFTLWTFDNWMAFVSSIFVIVKIVGGLIGAAAIFKRKPRIYEIWVGPFLLCCLLPFGFKIAENVEVGLKDKAAVVGVRLAVEALFCIAPIQYLSLVHFDQLKTTDQSSLPTSSVPPGRSLSQAHPAHQLSPTPLLITPPPTLPRLRFQRESQHVALDIADTDGENTIQTIKTLDPEQFETEVTLTDNSNSNSNIAAQEFQDLPELERQTTAAQLATVESEASALESQPQPQPNSNIGNKLTTDTTPVGPPTQTPEQDDNQQPSQKIHDDDNEDPFSELDVPRQSTVGPLPVVTGAPISEDDNDQQSSPPEENDDEDRNLQCNAQFQPTSATVSSPLATPVQASQPDYDQQQLSQETYDDNAINSYFESDVESPTTDSMAVATSVQTLEQQDVQRQLPQESANDKNNDLQSTTEVQDDPTADSPTHATWSQTSQQDARSPQQQLLSSHEDGNEC
ncbi:hypothetical protein BKA69DRAFT_499158 [Paraphysoderma sedebokerense]|nr:hypothetical protein BKA69DRAFT_499158 [Paraphysoderma sedebokerense]